MAGHTGLWDAGSFGRWFWRGMRCSMRTDRERIHGERRRRFGVVSPPFLSPEGGEEGREGKQDKGSVSQRYVSLCLNIFFLRATRTRARAKWRGKIGRAWGREREWHDV